MAETQFFPTTAAVAINNVAQSDGPRFEDINTNSIVFVTTKTWVNNQTGVNQYVFEVQFQETNAIQLTTYLFPRGQFQTVSVFKTILDAQASTNNVVQYDDWTEINRRPIGTTKDILLNDDFIKRRIYRQANNTTDLYVGVKTAIEDQIYTVLGDQEKGWDYYYSYGV